MTIFRGVVPATFVASLFFCLVPTSHHFILFDTLNALPSPLNVQSTIKGPTGQMSLSLVAPEEAPSLPLVAAEEAASLSNDVWKYLTFVKPHWLWESSAPVAKPNMTYTQAESMCIDLETSPAWHANKVTQQALSYHLLGRASTSGMNLEEMQSHSDLLHENVAEDILRQGIWYGQVMEASAGEEEKNNPLLQRCLLARYDDVMKTTKFENTACDSPHVAICTATPSGDPTKVVKDFAKFMDL